MKKIVFILLMVPLFAYPQARDMTAKEVAFENQVSHTLLNAVPKDFKEWSINFPDYQDLVAGTARCSECTYGKDCYWNFGFHLVYDGTTIEDADYTAFKDSMKNVQYDWHFAALFGRFQNSHQLIVDISMNETLFNGDFRYCGNKGFATLPPPAAVDHYLFASVAKCFPKNAQGSFLDVNLFIMGNLPTITDHPQSEGYNKSSINFTLNPALPTPLKVQNVVIRMYGSKKLAKEFISKMDLVSLKKLLQQKF